MNPELSPSAVANPQPPTQPDTSTLVDDGGWTKVIVPRRGWLEFSWRELWQYRDLVWLFAHRNLTTSYKQTVLGPVWFIVQPVMVTVVFSYLFGRMARFGTDDIPHYLFYMSGLVPWGFFAESVNRTSRTFTDNANLFGKVWFPRLAVPLSALLTNLIPLLVQFCLFLAGLGFYLAKSNPFIDPNWTIVFVPLLFVQIALLALGLGCIVSALTSRFRDLALGLQIGLQLWMFGSAIVFPLSRLAPDDRWVFFLNPIVPIIESFRYAFLGVSLVQPWHIVLSVAVTVAIFLLGVVLFNRTEKTAMDTL